MYNESLTPLFVWRSRKTIIQHRRVGFNPPLVFFEVKMTNLFARPTNHNCKILSQNQELNLALISEVEKTIVS